MIHALVTPWKTLSHLIWQLTREVVMIGGSLHKTWLGFSEASLQQPVWWYNTKLIDLHGNLNAKERVWSYQLTKLNINSLVFLNMSSSSCLTLALSSVSSDSGIGRMRLTGNIITFWKTDNNIIIKYSNGISKFYKFFF